MPLIGFKTSLNGKNLETITTIFTNQNWCFIPILMMKYHMEPMNSMCIHRQMKAARSE